MAHQIELHQFLFSNFCEKVRWTLDYHGMAYDSVEYLPFWHVRPVKRLSGQSAVPVIRIGEQIQPNSADIVAMLDSMGEKDSLIPSEEPGRQHALEWQRRLDDSGATIRGAMFHDFMVDRRFFFRVITSGQQGAFRLRMYGATFVMIFPLMKKILNKRAPDAAALREQVMVLLDEVEQAQSEAGYLAGDSFSIADLTAASLLYPLFFPSGTPASEVAESHECGRMWLARWREHPAGDYVRRMYRDHR